MTDLSLMSLSSGLPILWLTSLSFSANQQSNLQPYLRAADIDPASVFFVNLEKEIGKSLLVKKPNTKDTWIIDEKLRQSAINKLSHYLSTIKPRVVVVNNNAILNLLIGKDISLATGRGSVYPVRIANWKGTAIVIDDCQRLAWIENPKKPWQMTDTDVRPQLWFTWTLLQDLAKIQRWNTNTQRHQPKFDYLVCHTLTDLNECFAWLNGASYISIDIETAYQLITCIGYTALGADGNMKSFCIPFINPTNHMGTPQCYHWEQEVEVEIWNNIRQIHTSPAIKIFQNGTYDCSYLTRYNVPPTNYLLDTYHMMHSLWCESPKSLHFITSLASDHYQYWKDEAKAETTEDRKKSERIPFSERDLDRYWRYNCLDTYYNMISAIWLLDQLTASHHSYALSNYNTEFSNAVGPAFAMSMRGLRVDKERQASKFLSHRQAAETALGELRTMVDDFDFNPNSNVDVAWLLYDLLGCKIIKKRGKNSGRSAAEPVLKLLCTQHPLFKWYIEKIWEVKKELNNASKYGQMELYQPEGSDHGHDARYKFKLNAAGTVTGRYSGSQDNFGYGTNPQNVPASERDICIADDGYVLFEPDYSQSDGYYTAYELEDSKMQEVLNDPRDSHCLNASWFFNKPYEELVKGYVNDAPWVNDPTTGLRQIQKRISYGANYLMHGFTLYMTMGNDSVVATAIALGHGAAGGWSQRQLVDFCNGLLRTYWSRYATARQNLNTLIDQATENNNLYTAPFGLTRKFFGDIHEESMQRQFASQIGQAGTAGAINRTLLAAWYSGWEKEGGVLLSQTHDSILIQIPTSKLWLCDQFLQLMEQPCVLHGKMFVVPTEAKIGFSWKKSMITYNPSISHEETLRLCQQKELQLREEYDAIKQARRNLERHSPVQDQPTTTGFTPPSNIPSQFSHTTTNNQSNTILTA